MFKSQTTVFFLGKLSVAATSRRGKPLLLILRKRGGGTIYKIVVRVVVGFTECSTHYRPLGEAKTHRQKPQVQSPHKYRSWHKTLDL